MGGVVLEGCCGPERAGSERQGRDGREMPGHRLNSASIKLASEETTLTHDSLDKKEAGHMLDKLLLLWELTSFGALCCGALTGVLGLAADTGLVKTESRPCMWRPDLLISLPPDFHWVLWKKGQTGVTALPPSGEARERQQNQTPARIFETKQKTPTKKIDTVTGNMVTESSPWWGPQQALGPGSCRRWSLRWELCCHWWAKPR